MENIYISIDVENAEDMTTDNVNVSLKITTINTDHMKEEVLGVGNLIDLFYFLEV
jgi:hypothetical protein